MNFYHYSEEPLADLNPYTPEKFYISGPGKPHGFWVSVEDDWERWCREEHYHLERLRYRTQIILAEDAEILYITTAEELDEFTDKYRKEKHIVSTDEIDWNRVREEYQGIVIAPYIWSRRLSLMWYYTWDCASGCIWDVSIIKIGEVEYDGGRQDPPVQAGEGTISV